VSYKAARRLRGGRKWMLHDVGFELPAGRRVAVVGPSGAGKSTLLRMVLGLVEPESGAVRLDGRDLRELQLESVRRQMSVVFQESVFTRRSVRENLTLGLDPPSPEQVHAAVAAARLGDWIERLPDGYDTEIAKAGHLFSGGERQRLALARAILRDGRIWLLDEPITGLDPDAARKLTESLLEITRGRTTLWITHDPALVGRLDAVLELVDGTMAFAGTPAQHEQWTAAGRPVRTGGDGPCRL
jgi:ABC-type multidrug transport system fused ATPase/permease subunit